MNNSDVFASERKVGHPTNDTNIEVNLSNSSGGGNPIYQREPLHAKFDNLHTTSCK